MNISFEEETDVVFVNEKLREISHMMNEMHGKKFDGIAAFIMISEKTPENNLRVSVYKLKSMDFDASLTFDMKLLKEVLTFINSQYKINGGA